MSAFMCFVLSKYCKYSAYMRNSRTCVTVDSGQWTVDSGQWKVESSSISRSRSRSSHQLLRLGACTRYTTLVQYARYILRSILRRKLVLHQQLVDGTCIGARALHWPTTTYFNALLIITSLITHSLITHSLLTHHSSLLTHSSSLITPHPSPSPSSRDPSPTHSSRDPSP